MDELVSHAASEDGVRADIDPRLAARLLFGTAGVARRATPAGRTFPFDRPRGRAS
ncbi:hypothetical protein OG787_00585 [Streptomyces sp. NBC_00075]|uniref:Uncharacterized protein n=1 Tax=Streptomyces sp. NBC_00093 TaxID=2975649 RepID=A0AAU1ZR38_9ACTN